jgi:hypothetical protein
MLIAASSGARSAIGVEYRPLKCTASVDRTNIGYNDQFELTALIEWVEGDGRVFPAANLGLSRISSLCLQYDSGSDKPSNK